MSKANLNEWQSVERPARYTGNEWNIIRKPGEVSCRLALAFPNTYEIGMSHLGLRILYDLVNSENDLALERIFCPWPDREAQLRKRGEELKTLETGRLARDCDLLGFTLQTEMDYTNVLSMLDLSGLPLRAAERSEECPLVIAGGPAAFNPEPMAPFFDIVLVGDAEKALPELMHRLAELKKQDIPKRRLLERLEEIEGVYAPNIHETEIDPESGLEVLKEADADRPLMQKAMVADLDQYPFPDKMLVPYCDIVHDRVAIEIARGCSRGCRFCQAGVIYMPERRRSPENILDSVAGMLNSTGYNSVSITSLTPNDHPQLNEMLETMMEQFGEEGISVALASLSPTDVDEKLLDTVGGVKKTGITIAPEAGTQRLRDVINKGVTEEHILNTAETAFKLGWRSVKLYFMIGLPTETDEDIKGIAELARKIVALKKGATVKIGCNNFVPKSHTPFQWVAMEEGEELERKRRLLRDTLKNDKGITLGGHQLEESLLEGVLGRGDRRLSDVIELAWEKGCRFDGWAEHRRPQLWQEAFNETGIDPAFYNHRTIPPYARLPWSHLGTGVGVKFLREEYQKALAGVEDIRCKPVNCVTCRACPPEMLKEKWGKKESEQESALHMPAVSVDKTAELQRFRIRFHKGPELTFLGHLDLMRLLARTFRRAGIAVKYSQGFNPQPRISFPSALPLGQEGRNEYCEADLHFEGREEALLRRLNDNSPEGLRFTGAKPLESGEKSLSAELAATEYVIQKAAGGTFNKESLEHFMNSQTMEWTRIHKGKRKRFDIREHVLLFENGNAGGEMRLRLRIQDGLRARPQEVVEAAFNLKADEIIIRRENLLINRQGQLLPPM